jgi:hypothetical protein
MKNQLLFPSLSSPNKVKFRKDLFNYYLRKPGRSRATWVKNIKNYPHSRRFNLLLRSFIRNQIKGIAVDVNEQPVPSKLCSYIIKYYSLVKIDRVHDKALNSGRGNCYG